MQIRRTEGDKERCVVGTFVAAISNTSRSTFAQGSSRLICPAGRRL